MTGITRGWPPERRKKQAERIRKTRPWDKSTGPKTESGKAACKMNRRTHGLRSKNWLALRRALRAQRQFLTRVQARLRAFKRAGRIAVIGDPFFACKEKTGTFWRVSKALQNKAMALGCGKYWPRYPDWYEKAVDELIAEEYGQDYV